MTVSLRPITVDNWIDCIALQPTEEQKQAQFVSPNSVSLAQASFEPWWQPLGIYDDETIVGFVMYGRWPATGLPSHFAEMPAGVDYILRIMVDGNHQRKGYGREALKQVIERIRQQPNAHALQLSYEPENEGAAALYASLGFRPTGEIDGGEIVVQLDL